MTGGEVEISNGSYVAHSLAELNGGAFFVTSGELRVVGGSVVTNSTAQGGAAGALWLTGGKVTLSNSLLNASAASVWIYRPHPLIVYFSLYNNIIII